MMTTSEHLPERWINIYLMIGSNLIQQAFCRFTSLQMQRELEQINKSKVGLVHPARTHGARVWVRWTEALRGKA